MHEYRSTAPYRPPVQLAPPPPRRRRNRLASVPPVYRTLAAGAAVLLAAAVALRAYGVSGWWAALAAVAATGAAGWVTAERQGNRRDQAETAAVAAVAGGWLVFVAAAGWTPHRPGMSWLPGVPVLTYLIGVSAVMCLVATRAARGSRAVKAARAAGMTSSEPAPTASDDVINFDNVPAPRPPARPSPARPGPDEGAVTEIAAVCGIPLERVRPVWAHLTEHGSITGPVAAGLIGMGDETGRRMLRVMERAGFVRKRGGTGEQVYVIVRAGLLHRVR